MKEASISNFDLIWNMRGHFFSTKNDPSAKEGDEYTFVDGTRRINCIISEIDNDIMIWEVLTKEAI